MKLFFAVDHRHRVWCRRGVRKSRPGVKLATEVIQERTWELDTTSYTLLFPGYENVVVPRGWWTASSGWVYTGTVAEAAGDWREPPPMKMAKKTTKKTPVTPKDTKVSLMDLFAEDDK